MCPPSGVTPPEPKPAVCHSPRSLPRRSRRPSMTVPVSLRPCTRPARFIIRRCGSVQSFFLVSSRMFAHSRADGRWRFSGFAFQTPSVPPAAVPPVLAVFPAVCGSASPAGSGPGNRGLAGSIVRPVWSADSLVGTFRVGGRDQAKLRVEDVDQFSEVAGAVRITRCFQQLLT